MLSGAELTRRAMQELNVETPTELARSLGLGYSGPRSVRRWLSGQNDPDYDTTWLLLAAAGLLRTQPAARGRAGRKADRQADGPPESLEAAVAALAKGLEFQTHQLQMHLERLQASFQELLERSTSETTPQTAPRQHKSA